METWRCSFVREGATIYEAVRCIDRGLNQIAIVLDRYDRLSGIITDGDVRRAVLNRMDFNLPVESIMIREPYLGNAGQSREELLEQMRLRQIHQIPIIDHNRRVINIVSFVDLLESRRNDNIVVLMAGGEGTRLRPLTKDNPKPMLKVGDKPILEIILQSILEKGFHRFYLSVQYKSDIVESYFGDGSKWGVEISYIRETEKLGTAGSIGLIRDEVDRPILVMNGDILTKIDFNTMLAFHLSEQAAATMAVREIREQVPYGVVQVGEESQILSLEEKPTQKHIVNAGIYILQPEVARAITGKECLDMTTLFSRVLAEGKKAAAYPVREYWLDIGRMDDFEKAQHDYQRMWGNE